MTLLALVGAFLVQGFGVQAGAAAPPPVPPCGGTSPSPAPAPLAPTPALALWHAEELAGTPPPACTGWQDWGGGRVVAATGRFEAGDIEEILGRVGAVSRSRDIRYWSVGRDEWRSMFEDAFALSGPSAKARRPDFTPVDFAPGASLYLSYDESGPVGPVVDSVTVRERRPDRLVLSTRNVTSPRAMGWPIAREGDIRTAYFFDREPASRSWRYYALTRATLRIPPSFDMPEQSYLNRAAALFRFVAGHPTDAMPPPAP